MSNKVRAGVTLAMNCHSASAVTAAGLESWFDVSARRAIHRQCPLWVKSRHYGLKSRCPLYPQKRTFCAAVEALLFDYFISGRE
jgi:hypothetical protein